MGRMALHPPLLLSASWFWRRGTSARAGGVHRAVEVAIEVQVSKFEIPQLFLWVCVQAVSGRQLSYLTKRTPLQGCFDLSASTLTEVPHSNFSLSLHRPLSAIRSRSFINKAHLPSALQPTPGSTHPHSSSIQIPSKTYQNV
jgi:hypothetical protein